MSLDDCLGWVLDSAKGFREKVTKTLDEEEVRRRFEDFNQELNSDKCRDIAWVLHMFSGKDIFAALDPWFKEVGLQG